MLSLSYPRFNDDNMHVAVVMIRMVDAFSCGTPVKAEPEAPG